MKMEPDKKGFPEEKGGESTGGIPNRIVAPIAWIPAVGRFPVRT
jgi:hypothetical protein